MITQRKTFRLFHIGETRDMPKVGEVTRLVFVDKTGLSIAIWTNAKLKIGFSVEARYELFANFKMKHGTFRLYHKNNMPYRFEAFLKDAPQDVVDYLFKPIVYTVYAIEEEEKFRLIRMIEMKFNQEVILKMTLNQYVINDVKLGDKYLGHFTESSIEIAGLEYFNWVRI